MAGLPRVTVVCITYNQENYLAKALDGFVSQQTNFPFRVFVGNDCSTDGTAEVLKRYAENYPDLIIPFNRRENMGAQRNLIDLCERAESEYIAFCEGDDFWIDESKLQKQYDFMERHKDFRACFHDTEILVEDLGHKWFLAKDYSNTDDGKMRWSTGHKSFLVKDSYTIEDYIPCGFVHTSSMFFRWDYSLTIPDWYYQHIVGDYTIWALQIGLGRFGYINETMSVYRKNLGGCYDYRSREDFWNQTKADWISIDDDLSSHFSCIGASESLLETISKRRDDDLIKLLKAKYRAEKFDELVAVCMQEKLAVEKLSHVRTPRFWNVVSKRLYVDRLNAALALELKKKKSLPARTRRKLKKLLKRG